MGWDFEAQTETRDVKRIDIQHRASHAESLMSGTPLSPTTRVS
jgi:hypothetical protein